MKDLILYEDNHLIVVNKPAGMLVHGDRTGDPTLVGAVKKFLGERSEQSQNAYLGLIHRLDRPVSGAIVLAKSGKALRRMNRLFAERKVDKCYVALTEKAPEKVADRLEHYVWKDRRKNKVFASSTDQKGWDRAVGSYYWVESMNERHILAFYPKTGRSHQIRVQLSAIGCPICGDLKYGFPHPLPDASIALHSLRMSFPHPVQDRELTIETSWPSRQEWGLVRDFDPLNIPLFPFA